jgi:hypothetical protein
LAAVCAAISVRLADRVGPAVIGAPGGALFALGTAWFIGLDAEPNYVGQYPSGMLIGGAGVGLILPSFTASAVIAVLPARLATGIAGDGVPLGWVREASGPIAAEFAEAGESGEDQPLQAGWRQGWEQQLGRPGGARDGRRSHASGARRAGDLVERPPPGPAGANRHHRRQRNLDRVRARAAG